MKRSEDREDRRYYCSKFCNLDLAVVGNRDFG
jgi:hypothetical protein